MRTTLAIAALALLAGCSTADQQAALNYSTTACRVATAVEAADPAFASHNGKVVNGTAMVCAAAPIIIQSTSLPPAPAPVAP